MDVDVWYRKLWEAIPIVVLNLHDDEIDEIRQLFCVDFESRGAGYDGGRVWAPADDAARWRAATEAVVAAVGSVEERDREAERRLYPPYRFWSGLRWRLRWGLRRDRLRREYAEHKAALADEVRGAYRAYRAAAADLTDYVAAWRERLAREDREREARWRARLVAAVREAVDGAVWTYGIGKDAGHRRMLIWLSALHHSDAYGYDPVHGGLTARQVQTAIEEARAKDPYVWIAWWGTTAEAMKEWHAELSRGSPGAEPADEARAWEALTGVLVEPVVWRPGELEELRESRTNQGYGPSSNYWSSTSFGTSF